MRDWAGRNRRPIVMKGPRAIRRGCRRRAGEGNPGITNGHMFKVQDEAEKGGKWPMVGSKPGVLFFLQDIGKVSTRWGALYALDGLRR